MKIIPAIDILGGKCVRLFRGDYGQVKKYADDPIEVAKKFENDGAEFLHVIDLDGAKDGESVNQDLILQIANSVNIPIEVGGGIRNLQTVKTYLEGGVNRVLLGTKAVEDPDFLSNLIEEFGPERIVVCIDVKEEKVAIKGWRDITKISYLDFARKLKTLGVTEVLCTDVLKDGTLTVPNFEMYEQLYEFGFNVIAAGGVSTTDSIKKLNAIGLRGAVIGKAIYEGNLSIKDATEATKTISGLAKRIIPCLDVKNGRVVKGVNFKGLKDVGDPVELGKKYSDEGADELTFLDITASKEDRETTYEMVRQVARNVFIPFTVGGGIKTVEDVRKLLECGADKVSIGSAAVINPDLVREASEEFGSQCIVVSVDAKKVQGTYKIFIKGGSEETDLEAVDFCKKVEELGAGEILLNAMDNDGVREGFNIELLKMVTEAVKISVIASGGAGCLEHFLEPLKEDCADAVLAASVFHSGEIQIQQLKKYLEDNSITIRT
jgi:phosphoribosylformimino-5-aminoimidazole carboxamide ribotide isomerase